MFDILLAVISGDHAWRQAKHAHAEIHMTEKRGWPGYREAPAK